MKEASFCVTIRLRREPGRVDVFKIPDAAGFNVLYALRYIYENLDAGVAYPSCLCRIGKCGSCALKVNGKPALACRTMLRPGDDLLLEPLTDRAVIRDLVERRDAAARSDG